MEEDGINFGAIFGGQNDESGIPAGMVRQDEQVRRPNMQSRMQQSPVRQPSSAERIRQCLNENDRAFSTPSGQLIDDMTKDELYDTIYQAVKEAMIDAQLELKEAQEDEATGKSEQTMSLSQVQESLMSDPETAKLSGELGGILNG